VYSRIKIKSSSQVNFLATLDSRAFDSDVSIYYLLSKALESRVLFGVLRINIHEILKFKNVFATLRYDTGEVENGLNNDDDYF
jgi:hypothetical protein